MKKVSLRYRVDVMTTIGSYAEYTTRKGVALSLATSLAEGLKRQCAAGRLVEIPTNVVKDEWGADGKSIKASSPC